VGIVPLFNLSALLYVAAGGLAIFLFRSALRTRVALAD
jgi:hypothetical protein